MTDKKNTDNTWQTLHEDFGSPPSSRGRWNAAAFDLPEHYRVVLPPTYLGFLEKFGPGSIGSFLHFQPPKFLSSHRERMAPFMDAELEEELSESGDLLIFADSDNGDMCGWLLGELRQDKVPEVCRIMPRSFDLIRTGRGFQEFFRALAQGEDVFGIGPLPRVFVALDPY